MRALIGMVEIWMDPSYDLWYVHMLCPPRGGQRFDPCEAMIPLQRRRASTY